MLPRLKPIQAIPSGYLDKRLSHRSILQCLYSKNPIRNAVELKGTKHTLEYYFINRKIHNLMRTGYCSESVKAKSKISSFSVTTVRNNNDSSLLCKNCSINQQRRFVKTRNFVKTGNLTSMFLKVYNPIALLSYNKTSTRNYSVLAYNVHSTNYSKTIYCSSFANTYRRSLSYVNYPIRTKSIANYCKTFAKKCSLPKSLLLFKTYIHVYRNFAKDYRVPQSIQSRTRYIRSFANDYSTSTLYVGHQESSIAAVVEVDLDLETTFSDVRKLDGEILARGMDINVYELHAKYIQLQDLHEKKTFLENEREKIAEQVKSIVTSKQKSEDDAAKVKELSKYGKELKEKLRPLAKEFYDLEEEVMLEALKLPVQLHPHVPKEPVILKEIGMKPKFSFKPRSHVEIGEKTHTLIFSNVSPGAYYLKQDLASWSHDILCYIEDLLQSHHLTPMVCPDVVKTLVMEGCGQQIDDPKQVYTIEQNVESDKAEESAQSSVTKHLVGVSPMGFIAYLTKMNISEKCLPLKFYSIGTSYSPKPLNKDLNYPNLLLVPQAAVAEVFGCCKDMEEMEEMYRKYIQIMEQFYVDLNLPIRLVQSGSTDLDPMESARTEVQVWIPSVKQYSRVGFVSTWSDYSSRRLSIKYDSSVYDIYNRNYVQTVHGTLVHMPTLIAAVMENCQTQNGKFQLTEHLLSLKGKKNKFLESRS